MTAKTENLRPAASAPMTTADRPELAACSAVLSQRAVTLVEGSTFCVSENNGDLDPARSAGLFFRDTRILSRWQLHVDGATVEALSVMPADPFECVFIGRVAARAGNQDTTLIVERHRLVGQGMREDLTLRNYGREAAGVDITLLVEADFADLFQVKDMRITSLRPTTLSPRGSSLVIEQQSANPHGVRVGSTDGRADAGSITFRAVVPPQGTWQTSIEVLPRVEGVEIAPSFPLGTEIESTIPAQRMRGWRTSTTRVNAENDALVNALSWSRRDLGALRIADPDHPDDSVVAAGAPWFMALFGRDSILTSWMMMPFAPDLALGTLRTLARLQGTEVDPLSEEQPGRILHEVRLGDPSLALGGENVYYGSIDSTPLFVGLVGHALRWGAPLAELEKLMPGVDAALDWIEQYGDRDGDGFVEYQRTTDRGLLNQGWKDSHDSMTFADGRLASSPIALAEVQGYVYQAYLAKAQLEQAFGRDDSIWQAKALNLKKRFHDAFWMPRRDFYAMALDGDKEQLDVVSSNIGHCLWSGIVADEVASLVADKLLSPAMFTGFGIRTLSSESAAFNPVSYHNGSVWPHDSAIVASGLASYGFNAHAATVAAALIDTAEAFGGRLPELFCGFDRKDKPIPVGYPTSCSPQAWASAAPYELLRLSLGIDVDAISGRVSATPAPTWLGPTEVSGLVVGSERVSIRATEATVEATELPAGLRFEQG